VAHETARHAINDWIRTSGQFDAVIDFDAAMRDPAFPSSLAEPFDCGDRVHLPDKGYQALADAIDLNLFLE
jgi:lysophospholipase L1-like esterase